MCKNESFQEFSALKRDDTAGAPRLTWSGKTFHNVVIPHQATLWHKIFLRGVNMRKNVINGNYELWRLFMTDKESCPVIKMTSTTSFRELRTRHRKCQFNDQRRRVRISRLENSFYYGF